MNSLTNFWPVSPKGTAFHARDGDRWSARGHDQILARVVALSAALQRLGVRANDPLPILASNSIEAIEAILAAIGLGAVAVPINPHHGEKFIRQVTADVESRCWITDDALSEELLLSLHRRGTQVIRLPGYTGGASLPFLDYRDLIGAGMDEVELANVGDQHVALVLHTSGSTGVPKRIYRTHAQLSKFLQYNHLLFSQYYGEDGGGNPLITTLPVTHLSGLGYCLEGLYAQTPVYLLRQFDARLVLELVAALRCRLLIMIPSMYELLLYEHKRRPELDVSSLEYCLYGGEACPDVLISRIEGTFRAQALSAYGLTECLTGIGHSRRHLLDRATKRTSCGTQLFGEVRLVDDRGVTNADSGELWVKNETVPAPALGGAFDPRLTADGWFKTGDMLHRDREGHFFYRGRADHMFVCNGNNVYPVQVEHVLLKHPDVAGVCVAPIRNALGHTIIAAMAKRTRSIDETALIVFARDSGPHWAAPGFVKFVEDLPIASSGKLDRLSVGRELQHAYDATLENAR